MTNRIDTIRSICSLIKSQKDEDIDLDMLVATSMQTGYQLGKIASTKDEQPEPAAE